MSAVLSEHSFCQALRPSDLQSFKVEGVSTRALTWTSNGELSIMARDRVQFKPDGTFEFARYIPAGDASKIQNAYVCPLLDAFGGFEDLMAFRPGGAIGLWLRRVSMAGEEQIYTPRPDLGDALDVHESVLAWLQADRVGVCILDCARARRELEGTTIRVRNPAFGRHLQRELIRPAPRIVGVAA